MIAPSSEASVGDSRGRVLAMARRCPDGRRVGSTAAVIGRRTSMAPKGHGSMEAAIVTGADSGIGKATAVALARRGFNVGLTVHRDERGVQQAAREVEAHG